MPEQNATTSPQRVRRRGQRMTAEEKRIAQEKFLKTFSMNANVRVACMAAGIDRSQVYRWQEADENFGFRFQQATAEANDMLLAAAWKRGVEGYKKPVVSMGKQVYEDGKPLMESVYSDSLLSLLLKARLPEFRDKSHVDLTANVTANVTQAGSITIDTKHLTNDELSQLKALALAMKARQGD